VDAIIFTKRPQSFANWRQACSDILLRFVFPLENCYRYDLEKFLHYKDASFLVIPSTLDSVGGGIMGLGGPVVPFIYLFVHSSGTIFHERLEQL